MPETRFSPSIHGWNFSNSCFPAYRYKLPLFPYARWGKSERGLCGGMVFSALDFYLVAKPVPRIETLNTNDSDPVFRYLVQRLFDSFTPSDVSQYYRLQHPWCSKKTREAHSEQQLQHILNGLDTGTPVPFTLILLRSWNPDRLGENHQVLATGYSVENEYITIRIYDPNYPNQDRYVQFGNKKPVQISMHGQPVPAIHKMLYMRKDPPAL